MRLDDRPAECSKTDSQGGNGVRVVLSDDLLPSRGREVESLSSRAIELWSLSGHVGWFVDSQDAIGRDVVQRLLAARCPTDRQ